MKLYDGAGWSNPENKLVVCTFGTHYEVVTRAVRSVGFIDRRADPCFNKNALINHNNPHDFQSRVNASNRNDNF